jgi:D-alanyl-D-alanine carboxypeptidase
MRTISAGFFLSLLAVAAVAAPRVDERAVEARIRQRLDEVRAKGSFPGATLAVALADGRVLTVATGLDDAERKREMKPSGRMPAGSVGKTFYAAVALQLVQEGKLGLDDKISKYLGSEPWFSRLPNATDITVRMLMNHTSGIPEHVTTPPFTQAMQREPFKVWPPEELVAFVLDAKAAFEAGQGWSYADTNYVVLGMVIERVTGRPLYDEVRKRLLDPLKLRDTTPQTSASARGVAVGYSDPDSPFPFRGRVVKNGRFVFNPQFEWAGGGMISTAGDLARWCRLLFAEDSTLRLPRSEMVKGVPAKTGRDHRYGLGVQIRPAKSGTTYGHSGWFLGYITDMAYFPERKVAVAIQYNTDTARALGMSPLALLDEVAALAADGGGR